jgi:hypothetical protein
MCKIILKWLGTSFAISLIPVIILGASQGGIALSPYIIIIGLVIGLIGGSIHSSIYAFKHGNKKQRIISVCFNLIVLSFVGWTLYSSTLCSLDTDYANVRVIKYIKSKDELDLKYLGKQNFSGSSCQSTFKYNDPNNQFKFIVSEYGNLYFSYE